MITIRLKRNGPYLISAEDASSIQILDHEGGVLVPEPGRSVALCRCGGSATKPFCDRTHKTIGFCDVPDAEPPAASPGTGGSPS